jgi:hypothetical protein
VIVRIRGVNPDNEFTIRDGGLWVKDPSDSPVILFDFDAEFLAAGVTIESLSFSIDALDVDDGSPAAALTIALGTDSLVDDDRNVQAVFAGGTLGALYQVNCEIVTFESPRQTHERSILIRVNQQ